MVYTCAEYREEMLLLALKCRLAEETLTPAERDDLLRQVLVLEEGMGMQEEK